jgi:PIN domain
LTRLPKRAVVYDTGALLAADRHDDRFQILHTYCLRHEISPIVPAPVLTQAWRGGTRQARLSKVLRGCGVEPTSEVIARNAGVILGRANATDAVDAIVIATAIAHDALIVTSDPDDISLLWGASGTSSKLAILAV